MRSDNETDPAPGVGLSALTLSALGGSNATYLETMLAAWHEDPDSVDPAWSEFFAGEGAVLVDDAAPVLDPNLERRSVFGARATIAPPAPAAAHAARAAGDAGTGVGTSDAEVQHARAQGRIFQLINAHRVRGHLRARLDPLGFQPLQDHPELDPAHWGFSRADFDRTFETAFLMGPERMTLRELVVWLRETYCRTIGVEFMHIHDVQMKQWLAERFERTKNHTDLDHDTMVHILEQLSAAEAFEDFLHVKYRGAKRFSLQGAEALIATLSLMIEGAASQGVREIVLGMAHRGRLNVLVNTLGKRARGIFEEFDDTDPQKMKGRGDVKYHLGYSRDQVTRFGDEVHVSLAFNPSHLEFVNPVVVGRVRAKQDRYGDVERTRVLPVLIHGDAAFSGQGVVAETLQMMALRGYTAGGTIHIIVNNQIGFTTLPHDSRSSPYCTDLARMAQCPVIHVNGEDPEAVVHAARVATEFRQTWHRDVVIDMVCFRRFGHNEGDEPTFTQPAMYEEIARHPAVHEVYSRILVDRGLLSPGEADEIFKRKQDDLARDLEQARAGGDSPKTTRGAARSGLWTGYFGGSESYDHDVDTSISQDRLEQIVRGLVRVPDDFTVHPKLRRLLTRREAVLSDPDVLLDWGMGEVLAYGALVLDGHPVRISGQDCERGTFSHRHAVLTDSSNGARHTPLSHLSPGQARFEVHNSLLSETGVLGFEYGYTLDAPESLVIWEAQFGDFANGAQVIIDQFISASEDKWNRLSGLVCFLPHGYEGQGPEHSSARLERWLQLCAEDNMQVTNVTTPGQMFHLLRRQAMRHWRKPLIVMTPKSLLRHKRAASPVSAFTEGHFHRVIPEAYLESTDDVTRLVLCSGKVFYDLLAWRDEQGDTTTAIARLEQLYPLPVAEIMDVVDSLPRVDEVIWLQEEPQNMGAYTYLHPYFTRMFADGPVVRWVCREASASPATGSSRAHKLEQTDLMERAISPVAPTSAPQTQE